MSTPQPSTATTGLPPSRAPSMASVSMPFAPPETTVSDELCGRVLSLPIHPYITDSEIELVCAALRGLGLD